MEDISLLALAPPCRVRLPGEPRLVPPARSYRGHLRGRGWQRRTEFEQARQDAVPRPVGLGARRPLDGRSKHRSMQGREALVAERPLRERLEREMRLSERRAGQDDRDPDHEPAATSPGSHRLLENRHAS